ncbi:MAG: aspartate aminotransferase family protein [Bacteriovoracaceae bacterium]|nr:aspartate aminotransferase family protein [Bacteriovoracaceae bacterium]
MAWKKHDQKALRKKVFEHLNQNISYKKNNILGLPGSYLDRKVFFKASFLKDAPFLTCMLENSNHIGCHTFDESEEVFSGTQKLEYELLKICAEEFLQATPRTWDGYLAPGGTEANIQAMWIFRNFFLQQGAKIDEIAIVHSQDTHYSVYKAADLLNVDNICIKTDDVTKQINLVDLLEKIENAQLHNKKFFIFILNMGTTMFGSIDDIDEIRGVLDALGDNCKVHVDAAFGGFIYPLTNPNNKLSFLDPQIHSFSMDAHKMLQAPYGTGIFLVRRPFMQYARTKQASYVHGEDYTICGSRSGANAVAVWMILNSYGPQDGKKFVRSLIQLTDYLCEQLTKLNIEYFRDPFMNVVSVPAHAISKQVAQKFFLVPDNHESPKWWKIVIMDHVTKVALSEFIDQL